MVSQQQKWINKYFPKSPIAYQPGLSLAFRSISVGVFLSQLLYWQGKGKNKEGWIYKTIEEMKAETGLTRSQQDTAIRKCKEAGVLECKRKGIPAKRYFKLNILELEKQLPVLKESAKIYFLNPPTQFVENRQTITKNTQNTATKNNKEIFRDNKNSIGEIIANNKSYRMLRKSNDFGKAER